MDFQGLIGNVGGYIGLCLGYSILQIPDFIQLLVFKLKKPREGGRTPKPTKNSSDQLMKNLKW